MKFANCCSSESCVCCKILSSSFIRSLFILREIQVSVVRERKTSCILQTACSAFCRDESDCLYELLSPMYCLPVFCTFIIDFDQFEFQLMHDQNQLLLPWSLELQVLGNWRRSSELLVFGVFDTWSLESSSLQKLETFIRTSVFRFFSTWSETQSSEARTVHQNFLSHNLQLGFWATES